MLLRGRKCDSCSEIFTWHFCDFWGTSFLTTVLLLDVFVWLLKFGTARNGMIGFYRNWKIHKEKISRVSHKRNRGAPNFQKLYCCLTFVRLVGDVLEGSSEEEWRPQLLSYSCNLQQLTSAPLLQARKTDRRHINQALAVIVSRDQSFSRTHSFRSAPAVANLPHMSLLLSLCFCSCLPEWTCAGWQPHHGTAIAIIVCSRGFPSQAHASSWTWLCLHCTHSWCLMLCPGCGCG